MSNLTGSVSTTRSLRGSAGAGTSGTYNYNDLQNKPQINGVELIGNKSAEELGITGGGGAPTWKIGNGLKLTGEAKDTLEVDAANSAEPDNTLPITSAAVYTTVGNIEILLGTI